MRRRWKRVLWALFLVPFATLGIAVLLGYTVFSVPRWKGPRSDHFDGTRFRNPGAPERTGFWRWILHRERGPWPDWVDVAPSPPPPRRVGSGEMRVTFVNHATALIQMDGVNVLTDPVWSDRVGPASLVGPRRHRPPGLRFEDLPPLDAVVVSHNHYDHMDLPTLHRLAKDRPCPVLVPLGNRAFLGSKGIERAVELDWWEGRDLVPGVRVTCVPARHFSNRGLGDRDAALWGGFVVDGPAGRAFFAGDTGDGPHVDEIGARMGPFRLALLPIGAFRPRWFMGAVHMDPVAAVDAAGRLRAATTVAIHYGTFAQADDGDREPVDLLEEALRTRTGRGVRFWALENGGARDVPPLAVGVGE